MSTSWNRQRVSQACQTCQVKKIKCGGEMPRCETCIRHNRRCTYGISRRNTRAKLVHAAASIRPILPTHEEAPPVASIEGGVRSSQLVEPQVPESIVSEPQVSDSRNVEEGPSSPITAGVSAHLFETYFTCIHPIWPLLYKPIYDPIGYYRLADHLPKSVVYAIYAISSCLQDEDQSRSGSAEAERSEAFIGGPGSSASQFFEAALAELQRANTGSLNIINAIRPSISHCQTLIILALQQHGVAEFSRANLLCSLAATMAVDLKLHRCCGSKGSVEREVASRLWWNIYILEKMMSFEMGRPMAWRFEEADAPFPSVNESDEFELFRWPTQAKRTPRLEHVSMPKMQTLSAFHTTIHLCRLMERVSREVYSLAARELFKQNPGAGDATRMSVWSDVQTWQQDCQNSSLKLDLSRDSVTLPVVITNQVQINSVTIVLHRPFISRWLQHTKATGAPPFDTPSPSEICYRAAEEICVILESYSEYIPQQPCDLIFPIFTAASTFLHELRHNPTEMPGSRQRLKLCLSWLSVFAKNWKNAREREKMIHELYELPATPSRANSPSTQGNDSRAQAIEVGSTPQRIPNLAADPKLPSFMGGCNNCNGSNNELGSLSDGFPDLNTEFWSFLEGQHEWPY